MFGRNIIFLLRVGILFILFWFRLVTNSYASSEGFVVATIQIIPPMNHFVNPDYVLNTKSSLMLYAQDIKLQDKMIQNLNFETIDKYFNNLVVNSKNFYL